MENHGDRIEVREAFAKGESSSIRYSTTLTERTLYYARALNNGTDEVCQQYRRRYTQDGPKDSFGHGFTSSR